MALGTWQEGKYVSFLPPSIYALALGDQQDFSRYRPHRKAFPVKGKACAKPGSREHVRRVWGVARSILGVSRCGGEAAGMVWGLWGRGTFCPGRWSEGTGSCDRQRWPPVRTPCPPVVPGLGLGTEGSCQPPGTPSARQGQESQTNENMSETIIGKDRIRSQPTPSPNHME